MKTQIKVPNMTLNNGIKIPQIGFGTWKMDDGAEVEQAVATALQAGYRSFDTATIYDNEVGVGSAIRSSEIARDEVFITSKLWNSDQGHAATLKAFEATLGKLGMDYIDLYLIHWPVPDKNLYLETWRAMEELYKQKRVRAIGVCNFTIEHLERLIKAGSTVPAVNQVELHPTFPQFDMQRFCKQHEIAVESWSPLMQGGGELLEHPTIVEIAENNNKTTGQIVLRWHVQSGLIAIPKSSTPERIFQNIDIFDFELSSEEMARIDGLGTDNRVGPDPETFV